MNKEVNNNKKAKTKDSPKKSTKTTSRTKKIETKDSPKKSTKTTSRTKKIETKDSTKKSTKTTGGTKKLEAKDSPKKSTKSTSRTKKIETKDSPKKSTKSTSGTKNIEAKDSPKKSTKSTSRTKNIEAKDSPKKSTKSTSRTKKIEVKDSTKKSTKTTSETKKISLNKKGIFDIIVFSLTLIFIISMILLCIKYIQINKTKNEIENSVVSKNGNYDSIEEEIDEVIDKYSNNDVIGLLNLDNLDVSIPIAKASNNKYYLSHALDKSKSKIGSTFMDYRNDIYSKQINIYGHNSTRFSTPFKELENYLDYDYYNNHKYFELKVANEIRIYEIFSVIIANASSKEEHMQFNYETSDEWLDHFIRLKDKSKYELDVDVSEKDNIVILQTCLFGKYNGKLLVVVGKEIYVK